MSEETKVIHLNTASVLVAIIILVAAGFLMGRYTKAPEREQVPRSVPAFGIHTQTAAR